MRRRIGGSQSLRQARGRSAGQTLAAPGPAPRDHAAPADCGHPRAKAMPPLANDVARLVGTLHGGASCPPLVKPVGYIGWACPAVKRRSPAGGRPGGSPGCERERV
jgi:hypothetical protein